MLVNNINSDFHLIYFVADFDLDCSRSNRNLGRIPPDSPLGTIPNLLHTIRLAGSCWRRNCSSDLRRIVAGCRIALQQHIHSSRSLNHSFTDCCHSLDRSFDHHSFGRHSFMPHTAADRQRTNSNSAHMHNHPKVLNIDSAAKLGCLGCSSEKPLVAGVRSAELRLLRCTGSPGEVVDCLRLRRRHRNLGLAVLEAGLLKWMAGERSEEHRKMRRLTKM